MYKFSLKVVALPVFFAAAQLHAADSNWNPFDTNKLEMILCAARIGCPSDIIPTLCHYFTNLDTKTHNEFCETFQFQLSDMLIKKNILLIHENRKSNIVGDFFYHTPEVDPASKHEDLEKLKVQDKNKRFLSFKVFKVIAVNNQPIQTYIKKLEQLPFGDAISTLMFDKRLTLTCEPCRPNPDGKVASLDLAV